MKRNYDNTIRGAIEQRRLLQICYDDHYRVVEPNAYGVDSSGTPVLLAYQLAGGGGRDNGTGWRTLSVEAMVQVNLLDSTFVGPRPHYGDLGQPLDSIYCYA